MPRVVQTAQDIETTIYETPEDLAPFIVPTVDEAIRRLSIGEAEVVLFAKSDALMRATEEALVKDAAVFFDNYNYYVKREFQVANPEPEWILDPEAHAGEWRRYLGKTRDQRFAVFGLADGMVNHYASYTEDAVLLDPDMDRLFTAVTGTAQWKAHQNRFRVFVRTSKNVEDGPHSMHTEGVYATQDNALEMPPGFIFPLSAQRSFVWWEGSVADPQRRREIAVVYAARGGDRDEHNGQAKPKHFVAFTPEDGATMNALRGRRRRIVFSNRYVLMFAAGVMHEIDKWVNSSSLFLSPYNPTLLGPEERFTPGMRASQPDEYMQLNNMYEGRVERFNPLHERLGVFYHLPGSFWPSGKPTFHLFHMQAANSAFPRVREPFVVEREERGRVVRTFVMTLPKGDFPIDGDHNPKDLGMDLFPWDAEDGNRLPHAPVNWIMKYMNPMLQYRRNLRSVMPGVNAPLVEPVFDAVASQEPLENHPEEEEEEEEEPNPRKRRADEADAMVTQIMRLAPETRTEILRTLQRLENDATQMDKVIGALMRL